MARQFSPSDRRTVRANTEGMPGVFEAVPCGNGVMAVMKHDWEQSSGFTNLMEGDGWYLDRYIPREGGDIVVLMPVTEVPE